MSAARTYIQVLLNGFGTAIFSALFADAFGNDSKEMFYRGFITGVVFLAPVMIAVNTKLDTFRTSR